MAQAADQTAINNAIHFVAATTGGFMAPKFRTEIAVDVFVKRDDITEESGRKLLVDITACIYGLIR
jgi:hypothetical protein